MDKLNPDALAEWGEEEGAPDADVRPNVQRDVTANMIADYVTAEGELPYVSAEPFGVHLHREWNEYVEAETLTQRDLIARALAFWRGHA